MKAAKPASALLYDTAVWYLVWVFWRGCVSVVGMSDAMESKTVSTDKIRFPHEVETTLFFDWTCESDGSVAKISSPDKAIFFLFFHNARKSRFALWSKRVLFDLQADCIIMALRSSSASAHLGAL